MTTTQTLQGCPAWCSADPADHPTEHGFTVHRREVGTLGVALEQTPDDPAGGDPVVYVPELDMHPDLCASPAFARRLGADLTAAADLIEGVTA